MKLFKFTVQAILAGACLASPLAVFAQGMPPGAAPMGMMGGHEGPGEHYGPNGHHGGPGAHEAGPPFLHGIELSEAQQDKVFAIMHAQQPQAREQGKAVHKAHEALQALAESGQFDEKKAASLAQAAAQAMASMALQHARTESQVLAVLTPEQRKQMEANRARHPAHS